MACLWRIGASFENTIENLGGNPDDPFQVFPTVADYYEKVKASKIQESTKCKAGQQEWENAHPAWQKSFITFFQENYQKLDFEAVIQKENIAAGPLLLPSWVTWHNMLKI